MAEELKYSATGNPTDIIFECPHCSKSLAIDERGAGYIVTCPDCGGKIQVPGAALEGEEESMTGAVPVPRAAEHASYANASLDELRERVEHLERLLSIDRQRFEQISGEMVLFQAALDRIVSLLQDASSAARGERQSEMAE